VPEAEREVRDLLQRYFDALYASDADALRAVLHPRAIYVCATGEDFVYKTVDEYLPVVAERLSPASRNEARRDSIDSIELAGANTARARVRCSIADRDFIDFLTLVRDADRWSIISKVFHYDTRSSEGQA